ncbi:hypothetical protein SteCoe_1829 [Stentor coeruleus]|uniref:Uncharacterized protein n=1 Tax=Stentor coeruleus TaxID=5963 RepID=A0A1R2D146_9CILI|nr:hypothetical protein SteCoe_1829 [Stentor coeruleus]
MNPLLPILAKISNNKNKRLESDNLKSVISKVRVLQKRASPCGCANNPNANIKDLDLALEQSKRREQDFDGYISKELGKLNCLKQSPLRITKSKTDEQVITEYAELGNSPSIALTPIPEDTKKESTPDIVSERRIKTIPKFRVRTSSPGLASRRSKISQEFITRLSTPATKYFGQAYSIRPEILQDTLKADKLMNECIKLNKEMKKMRNIRTAEEKGNRRERAMMKEFITGKKTQVKDANSDNYKEDQLKLDLKIAKNLMRGKKIWKLNHVSFVATVDRMINSMPMVKK